MRKLELGRVAELATALPGTDSAGQLGLHWEASSDKWAAGMDSYATKLNAAADDYQAREDAAADGFRRMRGRGCPPGRS
ncbi:hypothetical protein [Actinokineospora sp. NPDC004072]